MMMTGAHRLHSILLNCILLLNQHSLASITPATFMLPTGHGGPPRVIKKALTLSSTLFYKSERYQDIIAAPAQKIVHKHEHIIFRPAIWDSEPATLDHQTAIVLLPGCLLEPQQYEALALAIQNQSGRPVWIVVPKLIANTANPLTIPRAVKEAMKALHSLGYPSDKKVFVGGHSLGGIFIPLLMEQLDPDARKMIAGNILLGSFVMRQQRQAKDTSLPRLTVTGDLDGLVRASRIAEDVKHHVLDPINAGQDADQTRVNNSIVLIPGMNHFQMIETTFYHILEESRDISPEISKEEAIKATASAIADFVEVHQNEGTSTDQRKGSLLQKIKDTEAYLQPLLDAMEMEGRHNLALPCNLSEDEDDTCNVGSSWVETVQRYLTPAQVEITHIKDKFRRSWYINPFNSVSFLPKVQRKDNNDFKVQMNTVSEAVYDKLDFFFDSGFFSNTAVELRAKLNSPQVIWDAVGISVKFEPGANTCSKMNEMTIEHAIANAPAIVRKRYSERGTKLQAGKDIEHNNGPGWIWSHLSFSKEGKCGNANANDDDEPCRIIDSHTLSTGLDHPLSFASGKLYCKLLSPARVLDWMYTDSLR